MNRMDKIFYYLEMAKAASARSTCLNKQWGAVIVNNDEIISTGYNGAPRGRINCIDKGVCFRVVNNIPRGTNYNLCASVHAEANAIISASRRDMIGSTMYLYGWDLVNNCIVHNADSCMMCKRLIINSGIYHVVVADPTGLCKDNILGYGYRFNNVLDWIDIDDMSADLTKPAY